MIEIEVNLVIRELSFVQLAMDDRRPAGSVLGPLGRAPATIAASLSTSTPRLRFRRVWVVVF